MKAEEKLIEAIQLLKADGYEFSEHKIVDTEVFGTHNDFSKRTIELRCSKYYSNSDDNGKKTKAFEGLPKDKLEKPNPCRIPTDW